MDRLYLNGCIPEVGLCLNGYKAAKWQLEKRSIAYKTLANGFLS
jgi:hypothetical protein